jgi:hypothetical protein
MNVDLVEELIAELEGDFGCTILDMDQKLERLIFSLAAF